LVKVKARACVALAFLSALYSCGLIFAGAREILGKVQPERKLKRKLLLM
jgi:hypothetical protein